MFLCAKRIFWKVCITGTTIPAEKLRKFNMTGSSTGMQLKVLIPILALIYSKLSLSAQNFKILYMLANRPTSQ